MMRTYPFTKMQGTGNDYIYMEEFDKPLANARKLAIAISDRHFGVGGDGLVLIGPSKVADFRMRIFNADGSEAEMCGNASRCVGKYLYERGFSEKNNITLETLAGIRTLHILAQNRLVEKVRVDMGKPILIPADIPMTCGNESFINQEIIAAGKTWRGTAVSMGNPHLVIEVDDVDALDLPKIGPEFEHHPLFPRRTNTEFVQVIDDSHVRMRVWERGAGETLACGTGACATLVACALNNRTGRKATVSLTGGDLEIFWADDDTIFKTGEAAFVFSGQYVAKD